MKLDCILPSSSLTQFCFQWRKGFYFPLQCWILHVLCHLFWYDQALCLQLKWRQTLPDLAKKNLILPHAASFMFRDLIPPKSPPLQSRQHLHSNFYSTVPLMNIYLKRDHSTDERMPSLLLQSGLLIVLVYSDAFSPRVLATGDEIGKHLLSLPCLRFLP